MASPTLPKPIAGLLGRIGVRAPVGEGPLKGGGQGEGVQRQGLTEGPQPGAQLGPDGQLRAGLGYALKDRQTRLRNLVEKANVERFVADMAEPEAAARSEDSRPGADPRERPDASRSPRESKETGDGPRLREDGPEARREDVVREAHAEAHRTETEARENRAEREEQGRSDGDGRGRDEGEDEEDRPGAGWVAEETEDRERRRRFHLDAADPTGATHRCRGLLDDGSRCLRKPMPGTPYCSEHRFS